MGSCADRQRSARAYCGVKWGVLDNGGSDYVAACEDADRVGLLAASKGCSSNEGAAKSSGL